MKKTRRRPIGERRLVYQPRKGEVVSSVQQNYTGDLLMISNKGVFIIPDGPEKK